MTRWTQEQLDEFNVRRGSWVDPDKDLPDPGPESKLGKMPEVLQGKRLPCLA